MMNITWKVIAVNLCITALLITGFIRLGRVIMIWVLLGFVFGMLAMGVLYNHPMTKGMTEVIEGMLRR